MIAYLERVEIVPEGVEPDFARVLYNSSTEQQDVADLEALIPVGVTKKHTCLHDSQGSCEVAEI